MGWVVSPADLRVGGFYVARHSDQSPDGDFPFIVSTAHGGAPCAWGFSVYRKKRGYRTLGIDLAEWLARPSNAGIQVFEDYDRRKGVP